jgi:hypothetical protein
MVLGLVNMDEGTVEMWVIYTSTTRNDTPFHQASNIIVVIFKNFRAKNAYREGSITHSLKLDYSQRFHTVHGRCKNN